MPQHAAGIRIEPPPSVPRASGACPLATAAAAPPEEPPGVRARFHGFRVTPNSGLSVKGLWPNSGVVVLPTSIGAGLAQPSHGHRVLGGHLVGEDERAHRRADAPGEHEVLHGERHAVERPQRVAPHHRGLGAPRGVARLVRRHRDERVDGGLERLDAREHRVHHRDGRHLLGADQAGEGQRVDVDHGPPVPALTPPDCAR